MSAAWKRSPVGPVGTASLSARAKEFVEAGVLEAIDLRRCDELHAGDAEFTAEVEQIVLHPC